MISWLLFVLGISVVAFAIVWAVCVRLKNYSFLDVAWSYTPGLLAVLYAIVGPGEVRWRIAFSGLALIWSFRLGTYILLRVLRHHPAEDVRYEALRRRWSGPAMFLAFFELQAVIAVIFSVPFLLAAWRVASPGLIEMAGAGVAMLSVLGEATADRQMQRFKADPANKGGVCQVGLWRYSRHPNYFFEFLFWVGISIACLAIPYGWTTLICPLLMLYFLMKVTGIPLTEEYALKSKGDAYREYQRTTSAFVPWFRRCG